MQLACVYWRKSSRRFSRDPTRFAAGQGAALARCALLPLEGTAALAGARGFGCALLALFFQFLTDALALEVGEIIDEQLAVDVIHLMLDADGENVLAVALE